MTALSESFSLTIICEVFPLLISTFLLFSQVRKPVLKMRRHVLSLFSWEHIKKVLICLRDHIGEDFCLVSRKRLRVQSGHGSRLFANGSQGHDIQIIPGQLDINGV